MPDVVVIGCGGGGAVMATELGKQGLDVLVLEAGPWPGHPDLVRRGAPRSTPLTSEEDTQWGANLDKYWNHLEVSQDLPLDGALRWGPADRTRPMWPRHLPDNMFIWQVAGVGGTTQIYLANCPRAYPRVFAGAAPDGEPAEPNPFPFTYEELLPFFEQVEDTLPVTPAPTTRKENLFYWGAKQAGYSYIGSQSGRSDHRTVRTPGYREQQNCTLPTYEETGTLGCQTCGHCFQGCVHPHAAKYSRKAKRSTLVSYVPLALATNHVTIRPNTVAMQVLSEPQLNGTRRVRGLVARDTWTGAVDVIEARAIVFAAGAIETPRLWMNSGLPDPSGQVGLGMTIHFFDFVTGRFPFEVEQNKGQSSAARFDFPGVGGLEVVGIQPAVATWGSYLFSRAGFRDLNPPESDVPWDSRGRILGDDLKHIAQDYERSLSLLVITDDEINLKRGADGQPVNGVGLALDWPPDEHGAAPKVTYSEPTPGTLAKRDRLARLGSEILRAAGAESIHRADFPPLVLHVHGTMRMGAVTDDAGEAHGVKGAFVADASILPNAVGGPNPTLTIQALATRNAANIARRYF